MTRRGSRPASIITAEVSARGDDTQDENFSWFLPAAEPTLRAGAGHNACLNDATS